MNEIKAPTIEDFKPRRGRRSAMKEWLGKLPMVTPMMVPDGLTKAAAPGAALKLAGKALGLKVHTRRHTDGNLWVYVESAPNNSNGASATTSEAQG